MDQDTGWLIRKSIDFIVYSVVGLICLYRVFVRWKFLQKDRKQNGMQLLLAMIKNPFKFNCLLVAWHASSMVITKMLVSCKNIPFDYIETRKIMLFEPHHALCTCWHTIWWLYRHYHKMQIDTGCALASYFDHSQVKILPRNWPNFPQHAVFDILGFDVELYDGSCVLCSHQYRGNGWKV